MSTTRHGVSTRPRDRRIRSLGRRLRPWAIAGGLVFIAAGSALAYHVQQHNQACEEQHAYRWGLFGTCITVPGHSTYNIGTGR